ncbi:hypothetical protein D3C73_887690 [compost metagenome]
MNQKKEVLTNIDITELLRQLGIEHVSYISWVCQEQASPLSSISMNAEPLQKQ